MWLTIIMAQLNPTVGNIAHNCEKALRAIADAKQQKADIIVFPELFLTGYPPDDLLYRPAFLRAVDHALERIRLASDTLHVVITHPQKINDALYNSASVFYREACVGTYAKQILPNTDVFDEHRYFTPGKNVFTFTVKQLSVGILICEDVWHAGPIAALKQAGAQLVLIPNASPFSMKHAEKRKAILHAHMMQHSLPMVYVNLIGGQDDVVFDGHSFVIDGTGKVCSEAPAFKEALWPVIFDQQLKVTNPSHSTTLSKEEKMYQALTLGLRDYIHKNGFKNVLLGLSGGIDSALSLCIAVDALGHDAVHTVFMPSRYTSELSTQEALRQATDMRVTHQTISIEPLHTAFLQQLPSHLSPLTDQNIQARCRGLLLMALSNQTGALVISTSNRSELAMGYSTLYGDMIGAFCVLKDVFKTQVYALAHYRNTLAPVIPEAVITRAPSAELAPHQTDQDTLPPYPVLDAILERYLNDEKDARDIIAEGFDATVVQKIIRAVNQNEYKRKQAPVGTRLHLKAFGRDRRYPITSGFRED